MPLQTPQERTGNSASRLLKALLSQLEMRIVWKEGKESHSSMTTFFLRHSLLFRYLPGKITWLLCQPLPMPVLHGRCGTHFEMWGSIVLFSAFRTSAKLREKKSHFDNWLHNHLTALMSNGSLIRAKVRVRKRNRTYITNSSYVPMKVLAFERVPGPILLDLTITDVTDSIGCLIESNEIFFLFSQF